MIERWTKTVLGWVFSGYLLTVIKWRIMPDLFCCQHQSNVCCTCGDRNAVYICWAFFFPFFPTCQCAVGTECTSIGLSRWYHLSSVFELIWIELCLSECVISRYSTRQKWKKRVYAAVAQHFSWQYIYTCSEYNFNANGLVLQSTIRKGVSVCFNNNGWVAFKFASIEG